MKIFSFSSSKHCLGFPFTTIYKASALKRLSERANLQLFVCSDEERAEAARWLFMIIIPTSQNDSGDDLLMLERSTCSLIYNDDSLLVFAVSMTTSRRARWGSLNLRVYFSPPDSFSLPPFLCLWTCSEVAVTVWEIRGRTWLCVRVCVCVCSPWYQILRGVRSVLRINKQPFQINVVMQKYAHSRCFKV